MWSSDLQTQTIPICYGWHFSTFFFFSFCQQKNYDEADEDCKHVLAEEISRGDGSLQASVRSMLLDGSLQEVVSILSKALYGEPMVC